tara:strand:+ start:129 stop:500 length:372 start_codon:yes stop_codon:yes gene_type:complete
MGIPSGAGTEVLKVAYMHNLTNTVVTLITGVANHIYTVLSISYCEIAGDSSNEIEIYIDAGANDVAGSGSQDIYILNGVNVGSKETFVFNDEIVLSGTDALKTRIATSANVDVVCSYIDHDFT